MKKTIAKEVYEKPSMEVYLLNRGQSVLTSSPVLPTSNEWPGGEPF